MIHVPDSPHDSQTDFRPGLTGDQQRLLIAVTVVGAVVGGVVGGIGFGKLRAGLLGMALGALFCPLATLGQRLVYQSRFRPPGKVVGALIWGFESPRTSNVVPS